MKLSDLTSFFKEGLTERYQTKPRDVAAARKPVLAGIQRTAEQFGEGRTKVPHRWWTVSNDVVAFSPKVRNTPLVINGQTTNHIESADFPAFLDMFRQLVDAGEFDSTIEDIENGSGNAGHSVTVRPARGSSTGLRRKSRPDDAEWMEKFTGKYGEAPSDDHVPNSKGTAWVTKAARARGEQAAAARAANKGS